MNLPKTVSVTVSCVFTALSCLADVPAYNAADVAVVASGESVDIMACELRGRLDRAGLLDMLEPAFEAYMDPDVPVCDETVAMVVETLAFLDLELCKAGSDVTVEQIVNVILH